LSLKIAETLEEIASAYPSKLSEILKKVQKALGHTSTNPKRIAERAQNISGNMGDYRLEAFVTRLSSFSGTSNDIEGIVSLALNKSKNDWTDIDIDSAVNQLAEWSHEFRKAETIAAIHDKSPTRHSISILLGLGSQNPISKSVDVSDEDLLEIEKLSKSLTKSFKDLSKKMNAADDILLAALAKASQSIIEENT